MAEPDPTVALLAAILCGAATSWPGEAPDPEDVVEAAVAHGVAPLLARAIGRAGGAWPRAFFDGLADAARGETALAVVRERALTPVLEALGAGGIRVLLIKGAHLAYAVYESPEFRPRSDTDLLIDETDRDRTRAILERLGCAPVPHVSGELVMPQFHFRRDDRSGAAHHLDVHWRLAVPQAFSALPALADLWDASMPIPALGPTARGPSLADALLVACAHRAAHHSAASALIWIVDVQRIAERVSETEAARFV
ncbi:MAG: nucleotidyltransferase family protein, partial [Vicinamibacterales bacterium]